MIVVGVDGSAVGLDAAGWAVREAALRGLPVHIVHAVPKWAEEMPEDAPNAEVGRWMRDGATAVLTAAVERACAEPFEVRVSSERLAGDPRTVLLGLGRDADLLVIGNHGLGGFRGLLLGSVALGVAGRAPCPVVVVRGPVAAGRGEVVVGTDGSAESEPAVEFAFAEAELRGCGLRAIRAWSLPVGTLPFDPGVLLAGEPRLLAGSLEASRERHPSVALRQQVAQGHPAEVLVEASDEADLVVVGSRGCGGIAGLILGSTGHAVLHHARCPVAVVPARAEP
ncbi:universal stress protein [Sphaerisporangium fuscum]|uniref:universal stress protein n=1 Tax=Sphaerisporangium fuscum TaxID=2835868 RepID=UPI001BDBB5EB|nr:universal stress protein [Sphaerisporangium fuscum]